MYKIYSLVLTIMFLSSIVMLSACESDGVISNRECELDKDCKTSQYCNDLGICITRPYEPDQNNCDPCETSDDCEALHICSHNCCEEVDCLRDEDCSTTSTSYYCQEYTCYTYDPDYSSPDDHPCAVEKAECMYDMDCMAQYFCNDYCKCEPEEEDNINPLPDGDVTDGDASEADEENNILPDGDEEPEDDSSEEDEEETPHTDDNDWDNDGKENDVDNCPEKANEDQLDTDDDGYGDVCDNCIYVKNPGQEDNDNDNLGNLCDDTPNGDTECTMIECIPYMNEDQCETINFDCVSPGLFQQAYCTIECENNDGCPSPYFCTDKGYCGCENAKRGSK